MFLLIGPVIQVFLFLRFLRFKFLRFLCWNHVSAGLKVDANFIPSKLYCFFLEDKIDQEDQICKEKAEL